MARFSFAMYVFALAVVLCVSQVAAQIQAVSRSTPTKIRETSKLFWSEVTTDSDTGVAISVWVEEGAIVGSEVVVGSASLFQPATQQTLTSPVLALSDESPNNAFTVTHAKFLAIGYDSQSKRALIVWSTKYSGDSFRKCYGQLLRTSVNENNEPSIIKDGSMFVVREVALKSCYSPSIASNNKGDFLVAMAMSDTATSPDHTVDIVRVVNGVVNPEGLSLAYQGSGSLAREVDIAYVAAIDRFAVVFNDLGFTGTSGVLLDVSGAGIVNSLGPSASYVLLSSNSGQRLRIACAPGGICIVTYIISTLEVAYYKKIEFTSATVAPVVSDGVSTKKAVALNPSVIFDQLFQEFVVLFHQRGYAGPDLVIVPYVVRLKADGSTEITPPDLYTRWFPLAAADEEVTLARLAYVPGKTAINTADGRQDYQLVALWAETVEDKYHVKVRYIN